MNDELWLRAALRDAVADVMPAAGLRDHVVRAARRKRQRRAAGLGVAAVVGPFVGMSWLRSGGGSGGSQTIMPAVTPHAETAPPSLLPTSASPVMPPSDSPSTMSGPSSSVPMSSMTAAPDPLRAYITGPTTVTAGQSATWVLHWSDGAGAKNGGSYSWGDGSTGLGAEQIQKCAPGATTGDGPSSGAEQYGHTYASSGTYTLRLEIDTIGCHATAEQAGPTYTVRVLAAPSNPATS